MKVFNAEEELIVKLTVSPEQWANFSQQMNVENWSKSMGVKSFKLVGLTTEEFPEDGSGNTFYHFFYPDRLKGIPTSLGSVIAVTYANIDLEYFGRKLPWVLLVGNGEDDLFEKEFTSEEEILNFLKADQPFQNQPYELDDI